VGLIANGSFGQGQIRFDNRVTGTTSSAVVAPIYGMDPNDPTGRKMGNPATAPTAPIPTGTQTYAGAPLTGSGFTATLWARQAGSGGPFTQYAITPFRVTTSTTLFGFWTVPNTAITLTGIPSDPAVRAEIIIRVWDNRGGTITSWDQLYDSATGISNPQNYSVARGESSPFIEQDQLGGGTVLPATLKGFQSFQLSEITPEPSVLALGAVAAGIWLFRRARKKR
jgi:hypothetical protein